ncbi:flagellar FliJ protein [Desulfuromusa kysingii]|uniref:Flagellar FliJ protein n=1 Tax=Desulfuromusa kysingii TaxID=37625 RepID=A0A1H3VH87_9BACT|nr:flagellar export protein FliJ [Desulfuromusa kysingii]SDZ74177.1 flagellar FliJ protein [Desulfuromusa kysingii]
MAAKFKLQVVLNYRQSLEDQAQQLLTTSLQKQAELKARLQEQQQQLQCYDRELKIRQVDGLAVAELILYESQIQHCRAQMETLLKQIQRLEEQILSERNELLNAARDRQVMEKLKDKQEAEYQQQLSRKERELLDEISLRNKGYNP